VEPAVYMSLRRLDIGASFRRGFSSSCRGSGGQG
jgi:hypothetical protein